MSDSGDSVHQTGQLPLARELELSVADLDDVSTATAFFVGLSGNHAGTLFKIPAGESILGRGSRSLVPLDEKAASHKHASLWYVKGRCVLTDQGSTNGTFVNEVRLAAPSELRAGDVVRLGKTSLGFLTDATDQEHHTRAMARATGGLQLAARRGTSDLSPGRSMVPAGSAVHALETTGIEPNGLDVALDKLALAWSILRVYWLWLVAGAAAGALLGALSILVKPPMATAELRIFLKHQGLETPQGRYIAQGGEYFRFASKNFSSPDLVKTTMAGFSMKTEPPELVGAVAENLLLRPEDQSIYVGNFYHPDADFAERFLAAHLHNYLEREIGKSIKVLGHEVQLLRKQYEENKEQLKTTETALQAFKEKHLAGLPENATAQLESRAELQGRSIELRANLDRYTQELALARKQHAAGNALVALKTDRAQPYEAGLAETRRAIIDAKATGFKEESPDVQRLRSKEKELLAEQARSISAEASDTERKANREHTALGDHADALAVQASSTKVELDLVQGRLGELEKIATSIPAVEAQFSELSRSLAESQSLNTHLYEQLKAKELKLEFDRASAAGRYEVVDPPSAAPVRPLRVAGQRAGVAGALGLGAALLAAALQWLTSYARTRRRIVAAAQSSALTRR